MSREEVVRVVSRALSVIQGITAAIEISYLPERFVSLAHDAGRLNDFVAYDRIGLAFLFFRIAFLLAAAAALWNCGPWIQRLLGPVDTRSGPEHAS